jgi:tRNA (cmo5U34)-methyltransferase
MSRDQLYSLPMQHVGSFAFDSDVVRVFPDMIARSVPGYASILSMIEQLTQRFVKPGTSVYDLGCSLGAATRLIRKQVPADCRIYAIDSSPAMISRLQQILDEDQSPGCSVTVNQADIRDLDMKNSSFTVLNLTLQFISVPERDHVISNVFRSLNPGGALLLSEKVRFENPSSQQLLTELHHDFKRANGYSDLEISQKRSAIENRLIPETVEDHERRLRKAGFDTVVPWFQCFNFVSILAVRSER